MIEKKHGQPERSGDAADHQICGRFTASSVEKVLGRHGIDIPRQTLARWVIQCGEHFQPLLILMRDGLLSSR
jgi:hypothetical protein